MSKRKFLIVLSLYLAAVALVVAISIGVEAGRAWLWGKMLSRSIPVEVRPETVPELFTELGKGNTTGTIHIYAETTWNPATPIRATDGGEPRIERSE